MAANREGQSDAMVNAGTATTGAKAHSTQEPTCSEHRAPVLMRVISQHQDGVVLELVKTTPFHQAKDTFRIVRDHHARNHSRLYNLFTKVLLALLMQHLAIGIAQVTLLDNTFRDGRDPTLMVEIVKTFPPVETSPNLYRLCYTNSGLRSTARPLMAFYLLNRLSPRFAVIWFSLALLLSIGAAVLAGVLTHGADMALAVGSTLFGILASLQAVLMFIGTKRRPLLQSFV